METTRNVEIGRRIKAARILSGKAVREFAREAQMSKRTLWRLEKGERSPTLVEAELLARASEQSVVYFLGDASPDDLRDAHLPPPLPVGQEDARS